MQCLASKFSENRAGVPLEYLCPPLSIMAWGLKGEHDFKSFCNVHTQVEDTVRTIYDLEVEKEEELITIRVRGNGFLYNMVRILAGTLIGVGRGAIAPEQIPAILEAKDRQAAGMTVPPQGLTLVKIDYLDEKSK